MKKRLVVFYTNCQSQGIVHFLNQTPLVEYFEFSRQNNWQLILGEQSREEFFKKLEEADAVIYQPTDEYKCVDGFTMPPSNELLATFCPIKEIASFVYQYNDGFFPLVNHGTWKTGRDFANRACRAINRPMDIDGLYKDYNAGWLTFDCARRFSECLAEQSRRESTADIKTVPFIIEHFQHYEMFVSENHPASALYMRLATMIATVLCNWFRISMLNWPTPTFLAKGRNDANMSGELPIHQAVVDELGLKYRATEKAHEYYLQKMGEFFNDIKTGKYVSPTLDLHRGG
jgi:hypothetical protein